MSNVILMNQYAPRFKFTACATSAGKLFIVTVRDSPRGLELVSSGCAVLELADRTREATRRFHAECTSFFEQARIDLVCLRGAPGGGKMAASSLTYKIEAILELVTGVSVMLIHPLTVRAWELKTDLNLPEPQQHLSSAAKVIQQRAIEVASWMAEHDFCEEVAP